MKKKNQKRKKRMLVFTAVSCGCEERIIYFIFLNLDSGVKISLKSSIKWELNRSGEKTIDMAGRCELFCAIVLAILIPPLGVCIRHGCCTVSSLSLRQISSPLFSGDCLTISPFCRLSSSSACCWLYWDTFRELSTLSTL